MELLYTFFVVTVIFVLPIFSRDLRQNSKILIGYWFMVFLREIVAFTNVYLHTIPGGDHDAYGLHRLSLELDEWSFSIGKDFYTNFLGLIYRGLSPSSPFLLEAKGLDPFVWGSSTQFLGEQFSILAFSFSCIIFLKLLQKFQIMKHKFACFFFFGTLPTMVLYGSVTLRESYQILFFMLSVFFGIKMHFKGGLNAYTILFALSVMAMGLFHNTLIVYSFFMFILFFYWNLRPATGFWNIKIMRFIVCLIFPLILIGMAAIANSSLAGVATLKKIIVDRNWLHAIKRFRYHSISSPGRTTYGIPLDTTSFVTVVYSLLKIYFYYLFAPFFWQVENLSDLYGSTESILRMILIFFALKQWHKTVGENKSLLGLMLVLFFSMTFMWAVGTTNYGTALRHNILSYWILVLAGAPLLMEKLSSFYRTCKSRIKLYR